jgi:peptide/nickel transport system substrate-binding protein
MTKPPTEIFMKTLAQTLHALALVLTLASPALAKDQWVIAFGEEPFTLNPAGKGALAAVSDYVQIHMFDALVDFTGPDLALKPMLAVRWENPNPTTWRFHLRRGVKFHNGDPFTAEDVKFTIDTQLANKGSSINAYLGPTETARVIDPYTIEITTKTPFPPLLFNVTRMNILPRAYEKMGAEAFAARPNGTGPYRFVEWQRGQRIVLDVNPDYWGGHATPKRLVFRPIIDPSTRAAELRAGGVDIVTNPPIPQVKELNAGDTMTLTVPGARVIAYPIHTLQKPLNDVRIRRALNYAVDRETIVKSLLPGLGKATGQPFSSGWLGYDPEIKPYPYDPAQAKRLLTDAGHPNGFEVTWNISAGAFLADREIAEAAAAMLGQVGVKARLVPTERAKIQRDLQSSTFDGITAGQWGTVAESDIMVRWFFKNPKIFTPELEARLDKLVATAASELDRDKRAKVYQELAKFAQHEALWLFIHHQDELIAKRRDIPWQVVSARGGKAHIYYFTLSPR